MRCMTSKLARYLEEHQHLQLSPPAYADRRRDKAGEVIDESSCTAYVAEVNMARVFQWPIETGTSTPRKGWSITLLGGSTLTHLPSYTGEAADIDDKENGVIMRTVHSPTTPVWNVLVKEPTLIDNHGGISSARLLSFLQQMYHAVVVQSFSPDVLKAFGEVAKNNFRAKCESLPTETLVKVEFP